MDGGANLGKSKINGSRKPEKYKRGRWKKKISICVLNVTLGSSQEN